MSESTGMHPHSFGDRMQEIGHDAQALSAALSDAASDVQRYLRTHVRQQPARTLAVAAGLGYVLGGGLRSRLTSLVLQVGSRLAMAIAARELGARLGLAPDASSSRNAGSARPESRAMKGEEL